MLTGRRAIDKNRPSGEQNLVEWAKPYLTSKRKILHVMDARIEGQYSVIEALKAANVALQCLSIEPKFRPHVDQVVLALEQLQDSTDTKGFTLQHNTVFSQANRAASNGPRYRRKSANDMHIGKAAASYPRPSASPLYA